MSIFKQGLLIFIVLIIVYMLGYSDQNSEVSSELAERTFQFIDWTLLTYQVLLGGIVLITVVGIIMGIYWVISTRRESSMRLKDGSLPLIVHKTKTGIHIVDPNQIIGPSLSIDKGSGELSSPIHASTQNYIEANKEVQKTRMLSSMGEGGFKYASVGKFLAGQWGPRQSVQPSLPIIEDLPVEVNPMTLPEAWKLTNRKSWVLGYHVESSEPFTLQLTDGHVGIMGGTGTGKTTYLTYLLIAYALRYSYQIVVLDGKNVTDYGILKSYIQYQGVDYESFPTYLEGVWETYQERSTTLKESGLSTIEELGTYPHLLIIFEELGAVMDGLRLTNQRAYKRASTLLGQLLRLSRVAGMQLIVIDQDPTKVPSTVLANLPMNLCFAMGGAKGNALGEYNLQTVQKPGQFQVRGERYWTWAVYRELDKILQGLNRRQVLPQSSYRVIQPTQLMIEAHPETHYGDNLITERSEPDVTPMSRALPLVGPPWSLEEEQQIWETYLSQNRSLSSTCKKLWGTRAPSKRQWIKDVVSKFESKIHVDDTS